MRAIFALFLLLFLPGIVIAGDTQTLAVGEQASLPVEAGTRFSIGNGEVIQVGSTQIPGGRSLLIVKGKSQGYSDLILLDAQGGKRSLSFRVVSRRAAAIADHGETVFSPPPACVFSRTGTAGSPAGALRISRTGTRKELSKDRGRGKCRASPASSARAREGREPYPAPLHGKRRLERLGVKSAGSTVLVFGDASSAGEKELAESLAVEVLRDARSQIRVPFEKGARLRFHARILEVLAEGARSLGLRWSEEVPGAVQLSNGFSKASFALDAALRLLEKKGQARLLAQPQLLLNEKGTAELQVGGEIPIPVHTRFFSAVQWKQYGLALHLELPGVSRDLARAHIVVEISTLDPANGADGVPAVRLSKMDTQVDMTIGKSVLLSGLLKTARAAT